MGTVRTVEPGAKIQRARRLRQEGTDAERRLWKVLRNRGLGEWKWRRQAPRGPYVLDFYCAEAGRVVEVDGGQHAERLAYDDRRTAFLERQGLRVLRFWNSEVLTNGEGVCLTILMACG